jgi:hypothetical protein
MCDAVRDPGTIAEPGNLDVDGFTLCAAATLEERLGVKGVHSSSMAPNLGAGGV